MYLRPHTTLKIGFKELVFDFKKSVFSVFSYNVASVGIPSQILP